MTDTDTPTIDLVHPVYLDVPMLVSFLAHIEGGVSFTESATTTTTGVRDRFLKARAGIKARFLGIGDAELGSEGGTQKRDELSEESKTERHHTAASLFNLLYYYLTAEKELSMISSPDQVETVKPGSLVEINARYLGNPIEDLLALAGAIFPYIENDEEQAATPTRNHKSGNPAKRAKTTPAAATEDDDSAAGQRLMMQMIKDIEAAPVHDLLFQTEEGLKAVVTAASEHYPKGTNEYLRAGRFRVIGKVTTTLENDETINLTRRTVLGAVGPGTAKSVIDSIAASGLAMDVTDPIVTAPALQILPMAIFI